ncbi:MAG: zinc-binding alcohol dehydrogenase [Rhodospirillales bacterium]
MTLRKTRALWYEAPGRSLLREEKLAPPTDDHILVRTLRSGLSRGTERLVFQGKIPESEWTRMRAPFQEGRFPFPIKYGYALVGQVVEGPTKRRGETVFLLAPHQEALVVPASAAVALPEGLPARRGVLAANLETAVNVLWDSGASAGDAILIVGGGILGLLLARLAAALPGSRVTVVDRLPERAETARAFGAAFALPDEAPQEQDLVIHTSASQAGLRLALAAAGPGAKVVEASWFGSDPVTLPLGGAFHSKRLQLISSQVGALPPERTPRWSLRRRLTLALSLLQDPAFDRLLGEETAFEDLPNRLPALLDPAATGFLPLVRYDRADDLPL